MLKLRQTLITSSTVLLGTVVNIHQCCHVALCWMLRETQRLTTQLGHAVYSPEGTTVHSPKES